MLFADAVQMLGERLELGEGAVGSVPAALIPIAAIAGALVARRDPRAAGEIGIGAILGVPFVLSTLGMFVVGVSALGFRRRRTGGTDVSVDEGTARRDVGFFLVCYAPREALKFLRLVAKDGLVGMVVGRRALHDFHAGQTALLATRAVADVLATLVAEGHVGGRSNERL